jgi:hypothetical protein
LQLHSPGSTTDLGQRQLHAPDLALVAETILANELQLSVPSPPLTNCPRRKQSKLWLSGLGAYVQTSGLERTTGDGVRLRVGAGDHGCCRWRCRSRKSKLGAWKMGAKCGGRR